MLTLKNLRISHKLLLGFSCMIVLAAATCLIGIQGMENLEQQQFTLYDKTLIHTTFTTEAYAELVYHNRRFYRHILADRADAMAEIEAQTIENEKNLVDTLAKYRRTQLEPAEIELLARFDRSWPIYLEHKREVFRLSRAMKKNEALLVAEDEGRPTFKELDQVLTQLHHYNVVEGEQSGLKAQNFFYAQRLHLLEALLVIMGIGILLTWRISRAIVLPLRQAVEVHTHLARMNSEQLALIETVANGDLTPNIHVPTELVVAESALQRDETGDLLRSALRMSKEQVALSHAMAKMTSVLRNSRKIEEWRDWHKSGINEASQLLRGDKSAPQLAQEFLQFMVAYLGAAVGTLYLCHEEDNHLYLAASWALPVDYQPSQRLLQGNGILGQAAREKQRLILSEVPGDYLPITSSLGASQHCEIVAQPLLYNGELHGVMELASFHPLGEKELELLDLLSEDLALAIKVARSRSRIEELLEQAQQQSEELRVQQEELQQSNEELEERAQLLEQQREQIAAQNRDIEQATEQLQLKADDLERISAYKSEFLANMSHELRSPLNSMLILSGLLQENRDGTLNERQVQFAATINAAGRDLLTLINDILDLSKVEAGHLDLQHDPVAITELCTSLNDLFQAQCEQSGIPLRTTIAAGVPTHILSDQQRLQQILRNLLANAFKFTEQGEVNLTVRPLYPGEGGLPQGIAFEVRDTGIGVAAEKQQVIFEAFQQADGSTSRKYGGTGLGLSIALQLAKRMGGNISLASTPGIGSTFTLCLPCPGEAPPAPCPVPATAPASPLPAPPPGTVTVPVENELPQPLADDRATLAPQGKAILIIEDDLRFAAVLVDLVRARNFAALVAADGESGIALANRYQPSAIILDVMLPHIDGWTVMRHLKDNPHTRHIPVHFVTCLDEAQRALAMGAVGYVRKPVDPQQLDIVFGTIEAAVEQTVKRLLIVEDNEREATAMVELLGERNVEIVVVASGKDAMESLNREHFDCIVLDLGLSDMSGFTLLEHIRNHREIRKIPVIVHSGQELSREDEHRLRRYAESIIIKGAKSPDRLLNEVTLFLHLVESGLSPGKQKMIRLALDQEAMLSGKKILLVDDDMRNIFSLSNVLAEKELVIFEAENGKEALKRLDEYPDIDLVLMDIMMPEMDGYATMSAIRKDSRFTRLPIIAMTAKALKGDQEKCLAAGASDYISKPIDPVKLYSLLRVWLYPKEHGG